ncbi:MAG: CCDC90 family protein [Magnetococcus sp. MYC-9]
MSTATFAIPFDTLAFAKELETAGIPSAHAEAQAKALSGVLQKVEEYRLQELATKGDVLRLERDIKELELKLDAKIEAAKVETIKWVIVTGIAILGGVAAINRLVPSPAPAYYQPPAQELRQPAPSPTLPALPAPTH